MTENTGQAGKATQNTNQLRQPVKQNNELAATTNKKSPATFKNKILRQELAGNSKQSDSPSD